MRNISQLKPREEIIAAMDQPDKHGLPKNLAKHVSKNVAKIEAQSVRSKFGRIIEKIKDPQILGTIVSLSVGVTAAGYGERENLSQSTDNLNYILGLLDHYIHLPDPQAPATSGDLAARLLNWISKVGIVGFGSAEVNQLFKFKKTIENGTALCPYKNHMVGVGFRDPLLFAEDEQGDSFVKRARKEFDQIVPIQTSFGFHNPSDLGTPLNDKGYYANLEALSDGTPFAAMMEHIFVSGSYNADTLVINSQREHDLFEANAIEDVGNSNDRLDLSASAAFVKNTITLRKAVTNHADEPATVLVVPMHMRQKGFDHTSANGYEPWARSTLSNFGQKDVLMPTIKGIIVPEVLFMEKLMSELKHKNLLERKIYIDAEGQNDGLGKADRCADYLVGNLGLNEDQIITDPEQAESASISVMLRDSNRHLDGSSQVNQRRLKHEFIFYPATTREDSVSHPNDPKDQTRVPILYKQDIADEVMALSTGKKSKFSVSALKERGKLPSK